MRKIILIVLCFLLLSTPSVLADKPSSSEISRVLNRGYMGQGSLDLERYLNRAELATIATRLLDLEEEVDSFKGSSPFEDVKSFQGGWADPYVAAAYEKGMVEGTGPTSFNPSRHVSYVDMLAVFMRILGYEDGMDFVDYPDDYYVKAVEIGLGDLYKDMNHKVTRGEVALAIERLLDIPLKGEDMTLLEKLDGSPKKSKEERIRITKIKFNTSITGMFTGQLKGRDDFSDYKVQLVSEENKYGKYQIYDEASPDKDGIFKIWNFDISLSAKLKGYEYRVYDSKGKLVLEGSLE